MVRLILSLLTLLLIALFAWGVAWVDRAYLLDLRPRPEAQAAGGTLPTFSLSALALATLYGATLALALVSGRIWQFVASLPGRLRERRAARRKERGYLALTQGLAAVAAGDAKGSAKLARSSRALLQDQRLTALLAAQSAQLQGREDLAADEFKILLQDEDTAFLGLRGLAMQALRQGRTTQALRHVKAAQALRPESPWVLDLLYQLELREGNARGCITALEASRAQGLVGREAAQVRLAPLYSHEAQTAFQAGHVAQAADLAAQALAAVADFLPAALIRAQALVDQGQAAAAKTLIRRHWQRTPHPDFVDLYLRAADPGPDPSKVRQAGMGLFRGTTGQRDAQVALGTFLLQQLELDAAEQALRRAQAAGSARAAALLDLMPKLQNLLHDAPRQERDGAGEGAEASLVNRERALASLAVALETPHDSTWVCASCGTLTDQWQLRCGSCEATGLIEWQDRANRRVIRPDETSLAPRLLSSLS